MTRGAPKDPVDPAPAPVYRAAGGGLSTHPVAVALAAAVARRAPRTDVGGLMLVGRPPPRNARGKGC